MGLFDFLKPRRQQPPELADATNQTSLTNVSGPGASGGDGSSVKDAVVIHAASSRVGIETEYSYIERVCGQRDTEYTLDMQMQIDENGRHYDKITVKMKNGESRSFWFDITSFFGKF